MRTYVPLSLALLAFAPQNAAAKGVTHVRSSASTTPKSIISGGGAVDSQYIFSDLHVQNDKPTAKLWASIDTAGIGLKGCSVDLFGAHGLTSKVGREIDIGGSCHFDLSKDVKADVSVSRYILGGATDITTLKGKVSYGPADITVTQYIVDGAEPDATKVELGYTKTVTETLSLRGVLVYEHGFGLHDIVVGGMECNLKVAPNFYLTGAVYAPVSKHKKDYRETQASVGTTFTF